MAFTDCFLLEILSHITFPNFLDTHSISWLGVLSTCRDAAPALKNVLSRGRGYSFTLWGRGIPSAYMTDFCSEKKNKNIPGGHNHSQAHLKHQAGCCLSTDKQKYNIKQTKQVPAIKITAFSEHFTIAARTPWIIFRALSAPKGLSSIDQPENNHFQSTIMHDHWYHYSAQIDSGMYELKLFLIRHAWTSYLLINIKLQ